MQRTVFCSRRLQPKSQPGRLDSQVMGIGVPVWEGQGGGPDHLLGGGGSAIQKGRPGSLGSRRLGAISSSTWS